MSKFCQVTGKKTRVGNNVSHANNKTKRKFYPNIHRHKFWVESLKRYITLDVSSHGMRIIDKLGIETVRKKLYKKAKKTKKQNKYVKRINMLLK